MQRLVAAVLLGIAISAAISLVSYKLMPAQGVMWPLWYGPYRTLSGALLTIAPGLVAGWIAGRKGLLVGAIVGACVTALSLVMLPLVWATISPQLLVTTLIFGGIANISTHSVAGVAGESLRRVPPNNSFKPKPLRGSA